MVSQPYTMITPNGHSARTKRSFSSPQETGATARAGGLSVEFELVSAGAVKLSLMVRKGHVTQREPRFDSA